MARETLTAESVADFLLEIKAIKLSPNKPFLWASGWKSPIYCDNRVVLSYPAIRECIASAMVQKIIKQFGKPKLIAAVATGGIGIGMLVAKTLNLPFIYVRPAPKLHGKMNQIEGVAEKGQTAVVIEDLISTGKSSVNAVNALREAEIEVMGMVAVFTYAFPASITLLKDVAVKWEALCDYRTLINQAKRSRYISQREVDLLKNWNAQPESWDRSVLNGGVCYKKSNCNKIKSFQKLSKGN